WRGGVNRHELADDGKIDLKRLGWLDRQESRAVRSRTCRDVGNHGNGRMRAPQGKLYGMPGAWGRAPEDERRLAGAHRLRYALSLKEGGMHGKRHFDEE